MSSRKTHYERHHPKMKYSPRRKDYPIPALIPALIALVIIGLLYLVR